MSTDKRLGITLPEVLLVLALGGTIMAFGIKQYGIYRTDADRQQLQYNIDLLFDAMSRFYIANCSAPVYSQGGALYNYAIANINTTPSPPYPIDLQKDLIKNGYLSSTPPLNPLVDSSTPGYDYILQFNGSTNKQPYGTVLSWKIQVAVLIKNQSLLQAYKTMFNANCISTVTTTSSTTSPTIDACTATPPSTPGTYLVFERPPLVSSSKQVTDLSASQPELMQFKQMYTMPSTVYLLSTDHTTEYQYINCGS